MPHGHAPDVASRLESSLTRAASVPSASTASARSAKNRSDPGNGSASSVSDRCTYDSNARSIIIFNINLFNINIDFNLRLRFICFFSR